MTKKQKLLGKSEIINHVLQFIFIFSSVFFAIWLNNRNETFKLKQIEKRAIEAVYFELQSNQKKLQQAITYHKQSLKSIDDYTDSLAKGLINVPPDTKPINHLMQLLSRQANSSGIVSLERNAYSTFQKSEAYVLLNYDIASQLSYLYHLQAIGVDNTSAKLINDILLTKEMFMPSYTEPILNVTTFTFRELLGQEVLLAEEINQTLDLLNQNYNFIEIDLPE